ncbi:PAS domain-containing sensor histidine kinase [Alkaliphilus serpentinus]|uniref:histidine kinase n=1 Tax=Alkaliphilus serpentinus TaxID=1482731 RepID=A0A833HM93_9FIRM|nr:ATP-binding protein [Alkaliphilus serpentinus]KAB3527299.1 PAS domain S-box protein [Alkaliphilus serpentinus]
MNVNSYILGNYNYCALINSITDKVVIFRVIHDSQGNTVDYLVEEVNQSFIVASGLTREAIIGRSIRNGMDFLDIKINWVSCFNEAYNQRLRGNCSDRELKSGSFNYSVLCDEDFMTVIVKDNRTEDEIFKKDRASYQLLIDSFPQGMIVHNKERIMLANKTIANLLNIESSKLMDISILDITHPSDKSEIKSKLNSITEGVELVQSYVIRGITTDNRMLELEVHSFPFTRDNRNIILSIVFDITKHKGYKYTDFSIEDHSVEKILEYDRMKTDFFSNISHEFKTPLNVILGTLQLMNLYLKDASASSLENRMRQKINIMQQNCYRLLRLVNNIIDITKIDRGYYQINLENHNIIKIVEVIALSVKDYIEAKGIKFTFETDIDSKVTACDPDKIERIILNLLSNAIKFTKAGGEISVHIKEKGGNLKILVKDTGIGIPPDKTNIIFERFIQVDKSFIKDNIGSGIGLSLVKSLVEMHNGKIHVESQLNKGSEFIIELPVFTVAANKLATEVAPDYHNGPVEKISIEFSDIYYHNKVI